MNKKSTHINYDNINDNKGDDTTDNRFAFYIYIQILVEPTPLTGSMSEGSGPFLTNNTKKATGQSGGVDGPCPVPGARRDRGLCGSAQSDGRSYGPGSADVARCDYLLLRRCCCPGVVVLSLVLRLLLVLQRFHRK